MKPRRPELSAPRLAARTLALVVVACSAGACGEAPRGDAEPGAVSRTDATNSNDNESAGNDNDNDNDNGNTTHYEDTDGDDPDTFGVLVVSEQVPRGGTCGQGDKTSFVPDTCFDAGAALKEYVSDAEGGKACESMLYGLPYKSYGCHARCVDLYGRDWSGYCDTQARCVVPKEDGDGPVQPLQWELLPTFVDHTCPHGLQPLDVGRCVCWTNV